MSDPPIDGWTAHADEQRRAWLKLSHAQRLEWLEQAKQFAAEAMAAAQRRRAAQRPHR
jgi:hypothetical protein